MSKLTKEQKQEIRDREHAEQLILRKTSAAFFRMTKQIDACLLRVLESKKDATTVQCTGDVIHIKTEGLI
jgi:hypothetical protein